jgi:type II secretory pathway pseudopilin PulG
MAGRVQRIGSSAVHGRTWDGRAEGFSVLELVIVFLIIGIMIAVSVPYLSTKKTAYSTDNLALLVHDTFRRANSRAVGDLQRARVRINTSSGTETLSGSGIITPAYTIQFIDENEPGDPTDDKLLSNELLPDPTQQGNAVIGTPVNVGTVVGTPLAPAPFNFIPATYTSGISDYYFDADGSCSNLAGTPMSSTVFIFVPTTAGGDTPADKALTRCVTLFGPTASSRLWRGTFEVGTGYPMFIPR